MDDKVVNLRRRRKAQARDAKREEAALNAARHGRGKADRELDAARDEKARRDLDGHERER